MAKARGATYWIPSGTDLWAGRDPPPAVLLKAAVLQQGARTADGFLVSAVSIPWYAILDLIRRDPKAAYEIPARKWEELVAGAYVAAGFDEVVITPQSGDLGRDVIATKNGIGSIRIYDQVKAYKPGHLVTAEEVRAMSGILVGNVSKGVVTTTSDFAPRIKQDKILAQLMPHRLELRGW